MQPIDPLGQSFLGDQVTAATVTAFDTPFPVLTGDAETGYGASDGLRLDVVEPGPTTGAAAWTAFVTSVTATGASSPAASAFLTGAPATVVLDGRTDVLEQYWGAGSPGHWGASQPGRVAIRWSGSLRIPARRAWFSEAAAPTWYLALAGSGTVRVEKTVAGATTVLFSGTLSERDYLESGFQLTPTITDMVAGSTLTIYYLQDGESWGGLVVKAVPGTRSAGTAAVARALDQEAAAAAPVLDCSLVDQGSPPATVLTMTDRVEVVRREGQVAEAVVTLPLLNPAMHDGVGYEWRRTGGAADPGVLVQWADGEEAFTLHRYRLVRLDLGFSDETTTVFTGLVVDWDLGNDGSTVEVKCLDFTQRLLSRFDRVYPDRISYMAHGFRRLSGTVEPVFNLPCFDNWPYEAAVRELARRCGITSKQLHVPLTVPVSDGTATPVVMAGTPVEKLWAKSLKGAPLRIERAVHYGNAGLAFNEALTADDPYIFPAEVTEKVWDRVSAFADRYGYRCHFDEHGDLVLASQQLAHRVTDFVYADGGSGATLETNPAAHGGQYVEYTGAQSASVQVLVDGARIDASFPRAPGLGPWAYTVRSADGTTLYASGTVLTDTGVGGAEEFFYDYHLTPDGRNATVSTLWSGDFATYLVTFAPSTAGGASASATRRLDCVLAYHTDPDASRLPEALRTGQNAFRVRAQGGTADQRNQVTVIGRRKATVTDSDKAQRDVPGSDEFVVQSAVDVNSVVNPAAANYVGFPQESVIVNPNITDDDFGAYVARTFIYRYRTPKPSAVQIEHTILPQLQLGDVVPAIEETYGAVDQDLTLWATAIRHVVEPQGSSTTTIDATTTPPYPSYHPRDDIDVDATFDGNPVINVDVQYTALTGETRSGMSASVADVLYPIADDATTTVLNVPVVSGALSLAGHPWPPVPGTLQIRPSAGATAGTVLRTSVASWAPAGSSLMKVSEASNDKFSLVEGEAFAPIKLPNCLPDGIVEVKIEAFGKNFVTYAQPAGSMFTWSFDPDTEVLTVRMARFDRHQDWKCTVTWRQAIRGTTPSWATNTPYHHLFNIDYRTANPVVSLVWAQGDGTSLYQRNSAVTSYDVRYRALNPTSGAGYTEPAVLNGGSPFYDPYTSELGELVTVTFDALLSAHYRISVRPINDPGTVVAWLTEPTADPDDPEAHFQFFPAGSNKVLRWDGVDTVGVWNARQSDAHATAAAGAFEQDERPVIGRGYYVWNEERRDGRPGPQALIAGLRDDTGRPVFGHGTYGAWAVHFEVQHPDLEAATVAAVEAGETAKPYPRVVRSDQLPTAFNDHGAAVVYTHLPEPTRVELTVHDWDTATGGAYADGKADAATGWVETPDADASVHNEKPVRVRFTAVPRPGPLWAAKQDQLTVKLTRLVHLKATIFDQFVVYGGTNYPGTAYEARTITSRRLMNDTHTLRFADDGYRRTATFKQADGAAGLQWVFLPKHFRSQFRTAGNTEALRFGDYLQLEEVPGHDTTRTVAGARSRLSLAFMNYLFYLSAFTEDRSGRKVWCENRRFLDRSKITQNSVGQWPDPETAGTAATDETFRLEPLPDPTLMFRRSIITRQWTDEPGWQAAERAKYGFTAGSIGDQLLRHKWSDHSPTSTTLNGVAWSSFGLARDDYTHWHAATATDLLETLPDNYQNLTRQLGTGGASPTSALGSWTWEAGPLWVPCVTRDFHGYFLIPPMMDAWFYSTHELNVLVFQKATAKLGDFAYASVDFRKWTWPENTGFDPAAGETWSSPVRDMTETTTNLKRFWQGRRVDPEQEPTKLALDQITAATADYVRQDELVHYEDLRGLYSRGPRPAEQPTKVAPVSPYYVNPFTYEKVFVAPALKNPLHYRYNTRVTDWFKMSFRSEYLWESGSMFPTNLLGRERPEAFNRERTRYALTGGAPRWDGGAYVGWKDDLSFGAALAATSYVREEMADPVPGVFDWGAMPVAVGPKLLETRDMIFHLTLVNERRAAPLAL